MKSCGECWIKTVTLALVVVVSGASWCGATIREISRETLLDKLSGFWIGQLAGNYLGF